jgi:hypothetical protein
MIGVMVSLKILHVATHAPLFFNMFSFVKYIEPNKFEIKKPLS